MPRVRLRKRRVRIAINTSMEQLYKYRIYLIRDHRQFDVCVPYKYPNEGIAILTAQYGGKLNVRVEYRGQA